jgi:metallo-beta-lactamase class B
MRSAVALWAAVMAAGAAHGARNYPADWSRPFAAHRIVGNVYYVGGWDLASLLITTPEGHVLVNTGLSDSAPAIQKSIADLGFKIEDVRWLLTTQAHYDHVEAMAEVKRLSGARMLATAADAVLLEDGGKSDFRWGADYPYAPVKVDQRISDGEVLKLGGVAITVHLHPGHTRGSASYSLTVREGGRDYRVLIANIGTINNGVRLTANASYPGIADDYARTFASQKQLACDVFLASHAGQYRLHEKYTPGMPYDPSRFVDPEGYRRAVAGAEAAYRRQLTAERGDDRSKIQELHRVDVIATRDSDLTVLLDLLDDDVVSLMPGADPTIGKAAAERLMRQYAAAAPDYETLDYSQDWKDLRIEGGFAYEWGIFHSKVRKKPDGTTMEQVNRVMRVLRKQPDGFWKVYRTMMN